MRRAPLQSQALPNTLAPITVTVNGINASVANSVALTYKDSITPLYGQLSATSQTTATTITLAGVFQKGVQHNVTVNGFAANVT